MGSKLFQRSCTVEIDTVKVENRDGNGLRIAFDVKQSVDSKSNTADVTIYNLNESSRGRLLKESSQFNITAGYVYTGGPSSRLLPNVLPVGLIFKGKASSIKHNRASVGWESIFSAEDGKEEKQQIVNTTVAPGATVAQIIQTIAGKMKVSVKKSFDQAKAGDFDGALKNFSNGFTLSGTVQMELDKLTGSIGADWTILNGELQITLPNTTTEEVVILSPATGLINFPQTEWKKIDTKGGIKSTSKKLVLKAQSLLQPGLQPGKRVRIKSQSINGDFRCISVHHTGDTDSDSWMSEIEAIAIAGSNFVTDVVPVGTLA